jgi:hypothetical protein
MGEVVRKNGWSQTSFHDRANITHHSDFPLEFFLASMIQTEPMDTASTAAELPPGQGKLSTEPGSGLQALPTILNSLSDSELSQTVALGSAIQQFRDISTQHSVFADLRRVAPSFRGQLLDFRLDDRHLKTFMKDGSEPPTDISIPTVKPMETVFPKDQKEAKALDTTLCEVSNRLLTASGYLLDVLQSLNENSDKRLAECIFRSLCLTASATSILEVERLLRPGDRDKVRDQVGCVDMPSVIQEVRRASLAASAPPAAAPPAALPQPTPILPAPPPLPLLTTAPTIAGFLGGHDRDGYGRSWRYTSPDDEWEETFRPKRGRGRSPRQRQMNYTFRRGSPSYRSPPAYPPGGRRRYLGDDGTIRTVLPGERQGSSP